MAACVSVARAQGADEALIQEWLPWAKASFKAPPAGTLAPELQRAAEEISSLAGARLDAVAPRWLAELRVRHGNGLPASQLGHYFAQRLSNEIGLWYLHPLPPELVEPWIAAATDPAFCPAEASGSWLARRAQRWDMLPAAARGALLQAERRAVLSLGDAPQPPPRPAAGALDAAAEMIGRVRRGQAQPAVPMPPVVARRILADRDDEADIERLNRVLRCALNQWWLRERLAQVGDDRQARADALQAFRFDWSPDGNDFGGKRSDGAAETDSPEDAAYPRFARQHELTGEVLVRLTVDARGRPSKARVVDRKLSVPGVVGRPVVYETLLDRAALHRLRGVALAPPAGGVAAERTLAMVFKLD